MRTVSPMTADREFSKLVREVERGQGFPIARHGRPVAEFVPRSADKAADPSRRRPIGAWWCGRMRESRRERSGSSWTGSVTVRGRISVDSHYPVRVLVRNAGGGTGARWSWRARRHLDGRIRP